MTKRLFDLTVAIMLLLILSPIILVVALLVRLKLGSPIVFKQQRPGLHGSPFYVYKFRTMTDSKDNSGKLLADQLRLTPFGSFLRKYSLDELLQLVNVIKGELSLVGPRPLLMEYMSLYTTEQAIRHNVRPGITGWAQIHGRNATSWEDRLVRDVWYVQNQTFALDLKILMLTVKKVIRSEGISNANHVTMPLFKGTTTNREG